ncbi:hypothetical protein PMAYCL1PPCAC_05372, partial [Pristionchus mayeri]
SEVFGGRDGGFFEESEIHGNGHRERATTTTTRRPLTTRSTTRSTTTTTTTEDPPTTTEELTTTTEEPQSTTEEPATEEITSTTTEVPSTPRTLPTRRFVFVTSPPVTTRAPTTTTEFTTTTESTTTTPVPVPEFVLDEAAEVTKALDDDMRLDMRTLRALTFLSNEDLDKIRARFVQDLTPMSNRFVPMGMGGRIASAAAVKTKNMDVEYEEEEEKEDQVEESNKNPGQVIVFDEEMGEKVRETRRIRLQNLNEPLRRFEKVHNWRRDKFVFVRPDRFYDKHGVELKTKKITNEAQLAEAIGLTRGRPVQLVSNDRLPDRRPSLPAAAETSQPSSPLIGVPIHIAAVTQPTTRRLTPPPVPSTTAFPLRTRAQPRPPAHTPPAHLLPEQLQLLQLAAVRPVQQPQAAAVQIPAGLTPPPRPIQQVQQPHTPTVPTLASVQAPHSVQQLQPLHPSLLPSAVQQVLTPPPQFAQIVFNQQPVAASLQSQQLQPLVPAAASAPPTLPPTTVVAPVTTVQQSTTRETQPQTSTSTPATTTTTAAATPAASKPAAAAAPSAFPPPFLPNPSFGNPIHPSIPFTPALNGRTVTQFLQQFYAQQQAIRAAAKQLQQLQRTPKAAPAASAVATHSAAAASPAVLQYPSSFAAQPSPFFWPPHQVVNPWLFPPALGTKNAPVGRKEGDVITVPSDASRNSQSIGDVITVPSDPKNNHSIVELEQQ